MATKRVANLKVGDRVRVNDFVSTVTHIRRSRRYDGCHKVQLKDDTSAVGVREYELLSTDNLEVYE